MWTGTKEIGVHDKLQEAKKWEKCKQRQGESFAKVMMKIKILLWNMRGVNNPEKRKVIKQFIRDQPVDLVCLQETKVQNLTLRMARSLGAGRFSDWDTVNASGVRLEALCCFGIRENWRSSRW